MSSRTREDYINEGYEAFDSLAFREDNPYAKDTQEYEWWMQGWEDGLIDEEMYYREQEYYDDYYEEDTPSQQEYYDEFYYEF